MNATRGTSGLLHDSIGNCEAAEAANDPAALTARLEAGPLESERSPGAQWEAAPFQAKRSHEVFRPRIRSQAQFLFIVLCALLMVTAAAGADKKDKDQGRLLFGKVLDQQDVPVSGAIVYLTNTRTHAVKTYIVSAEGTYRFPGLSTTVDYEVYAQHNNHKSDTKSVSQFDDRSQVYIDLRIDTR